MAIQTQIFRLCSICHESLYDPESQQFFKYYHPDCIITQITAEKSNIIQKL